jgi:hypothetical protein
LSSGFPTKILRTFLIPSMRVSLQPIILTYRVSVKFCATLEPIEPYSEKTCCFDEPAT